MLTKMLLTELMFFRGSQLHLQDTDFPPFFSSFFSSQVLFLICRKLIGQQLVNGTEVLKWLREILICRNKFLLKNKVWFSLSSVATTLMQPISHT